MIEDIVTIWNTEPLANVFINQFDNSQNDIFPSFPPNLEHIFGIRSMGIISNSEVTKDLEFDYQYILEMIEKFSITYFMQ